MTPGAARIPRTTAARSSDLDAVFRSLRELLKAYSPPLAATIDGPRRYELWSKKEPVIAGRKRSEMYFAAVILQKDYVGFYFMPVYAAPEIKQIFAPELLALLKGKSCFHVKSLDGRLASQIKSALAKGYRLYKARGWV